MATTPGQKFLVRADKSNIIFVPISINPDQRNFFVLDVYDHYKFNAKAGKFQVNKSTGILWLKKGENIQKLEGFVAKDSEKLLEKVAKRVQIHYLRTG